MIQVRVDIWLSWNGENSWPCTLHEKLMECWNLKLRFIKLGERPVFYRVSAYSEGFILVLYVAHDSQCRTCRKCNEIIRVAQQLQMALRNLHGRSESDNPVFFDHSYVMGRANTYLFFGFSHRIIQRTETIA